MLKKIIKYILVFTFAFSLIGCSGSNGDDKQYEEANKLVTEGKYKQAKKIYKEIKSYKDSKDRITDCDFLLAMEKSVVERMEEPDDADYSTLVDTELSYLEEFENKDFGNAKIESYYEDYIDGLNTQKDSLKEDLLYDSDYGWQEGRVQRFEALNGLYNDFNFLKKNKKFVANYIKDLDYEKKLLKAYENINSDIGAQFKDGDLPWNYEDNYMEATVKNNTNYTYDITYFVTYTTDGNSIISKDSYSETEIAPGMSYTIHLTAPDQDCNYEWEYQIDNVVVK